MVMKRGNNGQVRGRGQIGPRGLDSEQTAHSRTELPKRVSGQSGSRLSVKQRLGGGFKKTAGGGIAKGVKGLKSLDLRQKLNEKTGKTAAIGDLRELIRKDSSLRLKERETSGLRTSGGRQKLMSPVLAAAVSDLREDRRPRVRLGQVQRPQLPARSQLTAIKRTIDNPIPPSSIKFTLRNPLAEERFQDLTISRSFRQQRRKQAEEMDVDDEESEEEEESPPPPPRPVPKPKKTVASAKGSATPLKTVKSKMIMNRVRLAALPDNVLAKEVTELCEDFGPIIRVNRVSKGTFEVDFESEDDARKAVMQCSEATLDGEPLQVSLLPSMADVGASPTPKKATQSVKQRLQTKNTTLVAKRSQAGKKKAQ